MGGWVGGWVGSVFSFTFFPLGEESSVTTVSFSLPPNTASRGRRAAKCSAGFAIVALQQMN